MISVSGAESGGQDLSKKNRGTLASSFRYAGEGIVNTVKSERNIKIHLTMTALVIFFGVFLKISVMEWCICLTLFGLVLALELGNTAIEAVVDLVTEEKRPLAKKAKDAAAGAVLVAAINAAIAGLIIFLPKGIAWLQNVFGG